MKPNKCLVVKNFNTGGVERIILQILDDRACEIDSVIVFGEINTDYTDIEKYRDKIKLVSGVFGLFKFINQLKKKEIIEFIAFLSSANLLMAIVSCIFKIKLITSVHLYPHAFERESLVKSLLRKHVYRLFINRSIYCVCVSKGVLDGVTNLVGNKYQDKLRVVYNPIIDDNFYKRASEYEIKISNKYIMGCGRLAYQKGFDILIEAYSLVRLSECVDLVIVGGGDELSNLQILVKKYNLQDSVHFVGHCENPLPYYRNAEVFVLSSRYEGFGNVLAEALALGTKCVAFDCQSGPSEILKHGQFGTLVNSIDSESLARALVISLNKSKYTYNDELAGHLESFSARKVINSYMELFV